MSENIFVTAIIVDNEENENVEINGKTLISYSLDTFKESGLISEIIVLEEDEVYEYLDELNEEENLDNHIFILHSANYIFLSVDDIRNIIANTKEFKSSVLAHRVTNTIKVCDKNDIIEKTLDREIMWSLLPTQGFASELISDIEEISTSDLYRTNGVDILYFEDMKIVETPFDNLFINGINISVAETIFSNRKSKDELKGIDLQK